MELPQPFPLTDVGWNVLQKSQPQAAVLPSKAAAVGEEAPLLNVKGEA